MDEAQRAKWKAALFDLSLEFNLPELERLDLSKDEKEVLQAASDIMEKKLHGSRI